MYTLATILLVTLPLATMQLCRYQAVDPVCGTDGVTYSNVCQVAISKITYPKLGIVHRGPCNPDQYASDVIYGRVNPLSSNKIILRGKKRRKKKPKPGNVNRLPMFCIVCPFSGSDLNAEINSNHLKGNQHKRIIEKGIFQKPMNPYEFAKFYNLLPSAPYRNDKLTSSTSPPYSIENLSTFYQHPPTSPITSTPTSPVTYAYSELTEIDYEHYDLTQATDPPVEMYEEEQHTEITESDKPDHPTPEKNSAYVYAYEEVYDGALEHDDIEHHPTPTEDFAGLPLKCRYVHKVPGHSLNTCYVLTSYVLSADYRWSPVCSQ